MELASLELNNTIVRFRKVVGQAKYRITRKLIRRIKTLKIKISPAKSELLQKKYGNKLERYLEDVYALKRLKPDDVSKFALLNTKTLQELKITGQTPASDRVLYKVGTNELLVSVVEEFRDKYPNWHREVPFILQRLGLQYRFRKGDSKAGDIKKLLKHAEPTEINEKIEEPEAELTHVDKPGTSLLAKIKARRMEEKRARKKVGKKKPNAQSSVRRGKTEKKLKKASEESIENKVVEKEQSQTTMDDDASVTSRVPVSLPEGRSGQMEIRRILIGSEKDETSFNQAKSRHQISPSPSREQATEDPFFISGVIEGAGKETLDESEGFVIDKRRWRTGLQETEGGKRMEKERTSKRAGLPNKESLNRKRPSRGIQQPVSAAASQPEPGDDNETGLHPSWEAKRKQRLALRNVKSIPAGKKIKFEDD